MSLDTSGVPAGYTLSAKFFQQLCGLSDRVPRWEDSLAQTGHLDDPMNNQGYTTSPFALNLAAYSWASADPQANRLRVHEVTAGVIRLVAETDLHHFPTEGPRLFSKPFFIESKDGVTPLFQDCVALGGEVLAHDIFEGSSPSEDLRAVEEKRMVLDLYGLDVNNQLKTFSVHVLWDGREIVQEDPAFLTPWGYEQSSPDPQQLSWSVDAMRFAVVFALLLEAENAPLLSKEQSSGSTGKRSDSKSSSSSVWSVCRHIVDKKHSAHYDQSSNPEPLSKDGKIVATVVVRGFLRHQAWGPKHTLRKWIWVAGFETRRWISPKPMKVRVSRGGL